MSDVRLGRQQSGDHSGPVQSSLAIGRAEQQVGQGRPSKRREKICFRMIWPRGGGGARRSIAKVIRRCSGADSGPLESDGRSPKWRIWAEYAPSAQRDLADQARGSVSSHQRAAAGRPVAHRGDRAQWQALRMNLDEYAHHITTPNRTVRRARWTALPSIA